MSRNNNNNIKNNQSQNPNNKNSTPKTNINPTTSTPPNPLIKIKYELITEKEQEILSPSLAVRVVCVDGDDVDD